MVEIKARFNNMRASVVHHGSQNSNYKCGCLSLCANPINGNFGLGIVTSQATSHTFAKISNLWEKTLCPKTLGQKWFSLDCVQGDCPKCGFHILLLCNFELAPKNGVLMPWRCFQKVLASESQVGEPKEVVRLVNQLTTRRQFLEYATP